MFPTQTIYLATADVSLFYAIFNGVAMICNQTGMIWGFSFLVSMWMIVKTVMSTTTSAATASGAGAVLSKGVVNMVMPFIFAMLLTTPGLKTTVQVESFSNGKVTKIDNVPFVISVIPSAASLLSQEVGIVVETSFSPVSAEYSAISSGANGFINPLKVLMTSRSAIMKLGSIDSQVRSVVSTCLGYDSGTDYATVIDQVTNAGNTGATEAQTIQIAGVSKTGLGALLYQAAQNQTGLVPDVVIDSQSVASCADAANAVAANISAKLYSAEFSRAVQGSVNGMDKSTIGQDYSFDGVVHKMLATRNANTGLAGLDAIAVGEAQVKTETLNLLFFELVKTQLDCLKSDSSSKTTCQALATQTVETERANMQNAAQVVPMLQYAGQFANFMMALVIGMSPIIIMFMMFSGVNISKNVNAVVHVIVWPMLVMNVGAEIVNGMTYITVASFMQSIAQGGFITQLLAHEIYKEFSVQIGVASQIMASLPVIMSMIFVMGESAAMVSIAKGIEPTAAGTASSTTSTISSHAPLNSGSSVYQSHFTPGGGVIGGASGALEMASASSQYANMANEASTSLTNANVKQRTITEGQQNLADWKEAFRTQDYSRVGVDNRTGENIRKSFEKNTRASDSDSAVGTVDATRTNQNSSTNSNRLDANAGGSIGSKGISLNIGASTSVSSDTQTSAIDALHAGDKTSRSTTLDQSNALTTAISDEKSKSKTISTGSETSKALDKTLGTQKTFQKTMSESDSSTDAFTAVTKQSDNFVGHAAKLSTKEFVQQSQANGDFQRFQLLEGRNFSSLPAAQAASSAVRSLMDSGAMEKVMGSPQAQEAAVRHAAAVRVYQDSQATSQDRATALKYLTGEAKAMQAINFQPNRSTEMRSLQLDSPKDLTGVDASSLNQRGEKLQPQPVVPGMTSKSGGSKPQPAPSEADSMRLQVTTAVEGNSAQATVEAARANADAVGLGAQGPGTLNRVGTNTVKNATDALGLSDNKNIVGKKNKVEF